MGDFFMKRVCAYVRVSTASQDTGSQLLAIKQSIERSGDVRFEVYSDEGISGAKGRKQRPVSTAIRSASVSTNARTSCA